MTDFLIAIGLSFLTTFPSSVPVTAEQRLAEQLPMIDFQDRVIVLTHKYKFKPVTSNTSEK